MKFTKSQYLRGTINFVSTIIVEITVCKKKKRILVFLEIAYKIHLGHKSKLPLAPSIWMCMTFVNVYSCLYIYSICILYWNYALIVFSGWKSRYRRWYLWTGVWELSHQTQDHAAPSQQGNSHLPRSARKLWRLCESSSQSSSHVLKYYHTFIDKHARVIQVNLNWFE